MKEATERYEGVHARAKEIVAAKAPVKELPPAVAEEDGSEVLETPVGREVIRDIAHRIAVVPEGFNINPKMVSQLARRAKMGAGQSPFDWAFAELMAFGSLGLEGVRVRLSGQDSGRGTFSQRHAILYDTQTGQPWSPLSEMTARYLQLCAENNMQVCYPTTPAQYFHLLRRQVKQVAARPLVVMTPKSLLRLPAATSSIEELTSGGFRPVIDDAEVEDRRAVLRIVLCSGKVFYDLSAARKKSGDQAVAVVRLEQLYPFPERALREVFASYPNSTQLVWCQEEPKNMGGWAFVEPRLTGLLPRCERPYYAGRAASASPATGSYTIHELEQRELVNNALTAEAPFISGASTARFAGQADS